MTNEEIDEFIIVSTQLSTSYKEISILSKKKPNDVLNEFKLKLINSIISKANNVLGENYRPFKKDEFELFEIDAIPTNGDVVFILSNYISSMSKLKLDNVTKDTFKAYWIIDGEESERKA